MSSVNISLPEQMRAYVEEQVSKGGYGTVSEFVRDLIRQDQKRRAKENLETLLLEGLESGSPPFMSAQDWENIREAVRERIDRSQDMNHGWSSQASHCDSGSTWARTFIAKDNLDASDRFLRAAEETFFTLGRMPAIGKVSGFAHPNLVDVRQYSIKGFKRYLVFYHVDDSSVEVLRVLQGSQDLEAILDEEDR
jgi:putative addiction module CopG family antidote